MFYYHPDPQFVRESLCEKVCATKCNKVCADKVCATQSLCHTKFVPHKLCATKCATKCVRQSLCDKVSVDKVCDKVCGKVCAPKCATRCAIKCATRCAIKCATKCAIKCVHFVALRRRKLTCKEVKHRVVHFDRVRLLNKEPPLLLVLLVRTCLLLSLCLFVLFHFTLVFLFCFLGRS